MTVWDDPSTCLDVDDAGFHRDVAAAELTAAQRRALVARAVAPGHTPYRFVERVAALLARPDLDEGDLSGLARALAGRFDGSLIGALAPGLLAHPGGTDAVAVTLLHLPLPLAALREMLPPPPDTAGRRLLPPPTFCAGGTVLVGSAHPVAGAVALAAAHDAVDALVGHDGLLALTRQVRQEATAAGVEVSALVRAMLALSPGWAGTPSQLLESALAVVAG